MSQENFFELYPVRNSDIAWEADQSRLTLVFKRDRLVDKLLCALFKTPAVIRVELDEMGSLAWLHCDGKTQVHAMLGEMRRTFGQAGEPAPERLLVFLNTLREKGWIKIEKEAARA
ncbi:MAG TPA: PqqD family protein [Candidatus Deferrimicrobium sp.]|nr:PqqD family protein [Candidatus Deferrimicrobium sp.]